MEVMGWALLYFVRLNHRLNLQVSTVRWCVTNWFLLTLFGFRSVMNAHHCASPPVHNPCTIRKTKSMQVPNSPHAWQNHFKPFSLSPKFS